MMNDLRVGKHTHVLVYSFSRFARSTQHLLFALEEFDRLGVAFVSLTEKVDTSSAVGRAMFTIISAISQLERELISERVKNGLEAAKARGKRLGRPKSRPSELIMSLLEKGCTYREIGRIAKCSQGVIADEAKIWRSLKGD